MRAGPGEAPGEPRATEKPPPTGPAPNAGDGRIPAETALHAWQVAAELCGDPWFGLSAARHLPSDYLGAMSFAIHGSTTLGAALQRLARIFALVNQHASLELVEDGAVAHVGTAERDPQARGVARAVILVSGGDPGGRVDRSPQPCDAIRSGGSSTVRRLEGERLHPKIGPDDVRLFDAGEVGALAAELADEPRARRLRNTERDPSAKPAPRSADELAAPAALRHHAKTRLVVLAFAW